MPTEHHEDTVCFGPFRLYPGARLLERDGKPVHVGGRALDILIFLAERAGEVVNKRELLERVWSEVTVDEGSLRFHITALRKALGDGKAGARYVTNVPGRGYCLVASVSRPKQASSGAKAQMPVRQTLPARLARMVGRDETVQIVTEALATHRFVTIVGPGGIGKTTVATAAGHRLMSAFPGQVSFVDLAPLTDPKLLSGAVASTLGLLVSSNDPMGPLIDYVQDSRLLLILDGCEHLIEPVAILAETLFKAAPGVNILVTSRESLRVEGEHVHRLFPLRFPPQGQDDLNALSVLTFPAAELFIERAIATSGAFELSDADAPALADICRRLDGIPLAIELAAARADAFGIKELAALLDDRLLPTTRGRRTAIPRHQTLKATLDWSYERLPRPLQLLLNRLSVFNGAFTLAATSAVCSGEGLSGIDIPDGIADLVAKSLVAASPGTEAPYRLLDTTRHYAREQLEQSGERDAFAERHARYICELFQAGAKQWEERPSIAWLASYRAQIDNLRAALRWAFSEKGDPVLGIALTIAAVPLWSQLSLVDESLDWVERALLHSGSLHKNRRDEMQLYAALAGLQMYAISSVKQSGNAWETVLTIAAEVGETDYQLRALRALWAEAINSGEFRNALSLAERFRDLALGIGSADEEIVADRLIGTALHFLGDQDRAHVATERMLERYVASVARSQTVRYQFNQKVSARIIRGRILWVRGRTSSALRDIEENVSEALTLEHTMSLCNVLTQSACPIALLAGKFETAKYYIDLLREHTAPRALDIWYAYAICFQAALDIERGDVERGLDRLQPAIEELRRSGFGHYRTSFLMMRARGLLLLSRGTDANAALAEAIDTCKRTGERWCLPELHRLTGEVSLHQQRSAGIEPAIEAFHRALKIAREQQALAWEVRAATSLVRCLDGDPRIDSARVLLREIHSQFMEGHDSPELVAAAELLEQPATH